MLCFKRRHLCILFHFFPPTYAVAPIQSCFIHELRWDTKGEITCCAPPPPLFFAHGLNILFPGWAAMAGSLYIFRHVTPEVCCSQDPMTLRYTLRHPRGQRKEAEGPANSCRSNHQSQHGRPSRGLTGACDRSAAPLTALLHCPSAPSAPQLAPVLFGVLLSVLAACQKKKKKKSQKPQRKCKYPLMALIQMDAPMTIAPPLPAVWVFVSEKHRGHHNNTAELCMRDRPH